MVDFAALTGNNLLAAEQGCLEMQVTLPENDELYFCLGIKGTPVYAARLPTYGAAFLGNSNDGTPFYTNIPGYPALYQSCEGDCDGPTVITFSGITVVTKNNVPVTGWEATSADAESTDVNESITWTSNADLNILPDNIAGVPNPVGNACEGNTETGGGGLTGNGTTQIECSGGTGSANPPGTGETSANKTGTAMVWALTPKTVTATMVGSGLEAISFGLIL
jgi:hypothetical protein